MTQKTAEEIYIYDKEGEECNSSDEEPINSFAPQTSWNEQEVEDPVTSHKMSFKRTDEPFWMTLVYSMIKKFRDYHCGYLERLKLERGWPLVY